MKKKYLICGIIVILLLVGGCFIVFNKNESKNNNIMDDDYEKEDNFSINLIKEINKQREENYLISPYSIEIALNMLRDGARGNTKDEIDSVIYNRKINSIIVKNRIGVANAAFIRNKYKNYVEKDYYDTLKNSYNAEILYDEFNTPEVINNWVNDKTSGMIKKVVDEIDDDFVLGLANALAIDVEWENQFECNNTNSEKFTKSDGTGINVEMMHSDYKTSDYKYIELANAKGIIIPYRRYDSETGEENYTGDSRLEFIGLLPNDNINSFINSLTIDTLDNLDSNSREASSDLTIRLSLPRFNYEYDLKDFSSILYNMGIRDAFDPVNADFTGIIERNNEVDNLYVGVAVHKTYIDLNEKGTKAAAVTYFGMKDSASMADKSEIIDISFNKPFVYMIRDVETKEILFFGTVYEPNLWEGTTCSN